MRNLTPLAALAVLGSAPLLAADRPSRQWDYPAAPQGNVVDDSHGMKVADPYRWLEDLDSPRTQAWVAAENTLTFGFLGINPAP